VPGWRLEIFPVARIVHQSQGVNLPICLGTPFDRGVEEPGSIRVRHEQSVRAEERQGDVVVQVIEFPSVTATFGRFAEFAGPFTLFELHVEGQPVDIGRKRPLGLRTVDDLGKLDSIWGLAGVSLAKLDLRDQMKAVEKFTFDSRTVWPAQDRLPAGFDPTPLLEER
jgi:hypothetical protein